MNQLIILLLLFTFYTYSQDTVTVVKINDGDTFEINTVHKKFWDTLRLAINRMKETETEQLKKLDEKINKEIHDATQEQIDKLKS